MPNISISDQDIANVILSQSKLGATSLTNLVLESTSIPLRNDVSSILQNTFTHQKQVFDLMSQKGWYQVQTASNQDITTAKQSVSSMQTNY